MLEYFQRTTHDLLVLSAQSICHIFTINVCISDTADVDQLFVRLQSSQLEIKLDFSLQRAT